MSEQMNLQKTNNNDKQEEEFNLIDEILDWIESFVFASFMVLLIFIFLFRTVVVDGDSMNPTLFTTQRLILMHFNYTPERGDIIVFNSPGINKTLIKRCIGLPGDKVTIDYNSDEVTVNGELLDESYLGTGLDMFDSITTFDGAYCLGDSKYEYEVPEGTVFAMGDNRNNSRDSRAGDVGFVEYDDILGKAWFRFYIGKDYNGSKNPGNIGFLK